ncbi:MAG: preprotein translocase subunit SecY [Verrucomicrobiales bacterium]
MISAFSNIFKVPELRERILFTLAMIVVARIGAVIAIPGINVGVLNAYFADRAAADSGATVLTLLNLFSGGALEQCAIFYLGIMPYISASIIMQMMKAVIPRLNKLEREDGGRQKIQQYTRYLTLFLCVFQGYFFSLTLVHPQANSFLPGITDTIDQLGTPLVSMDPTFFIPICVLVITAGSLMLMWIGDQITERGVGNGTSLIITISIVAALPGALIQAWRTFVGSGDAGDERLSPILLVMMIAFLLFVIAAVIAITQAQRKVTVQYAKRVVGRKVYGGQTQFLPLKVNYAGVMPIIFAQALLLFPATIVSFVFPESDMAEGMANFITTGWFFYVFMAAMIFFFSYFWVAMQFQPAQIADDLKKAGGYIPGIRPGKATSDFLDYTMSRLTFAGAFFLAIIAVMPQSLQQIASIPYLPASFFGGTSLLIIVGVVLDAMRQIETHLIQRHYDGFLRKGRIRGRFDRAVQTGNAASGSLLIWLYAGIGILIIIGVAVFFAQ